MGVVHQRLANNSRYAWRPYFRVVVGNRVFNTPSHIDVFGNPGRVWGSNGYVRGRSMTVGINIFDGFGSGRPNYSRVQLGTSGEAYHANWDGTDGRTWLVQWSYSYVPRLNAPTEWRVLATIAIDSRFTEWDIANAAYVHGIFNLIRLGGYTPTFQRHLIRRNLGSAEEEFGSWRLRSYR